MIRRQPGSPRTDTPFPYTTLFRYRLFSLLVTTDFSARYFVEHVKRAGLSSRFASCHPVGIAPEDLGTHSEGTFRSLVEAAEEAIIQARADTLILRDRKSTRLNSSH